MTKETQIGQKFWKALKSDMTVMLGLTDFEGGRAQPMTAQLEGDGGPIWFFSAKDVDLVRNTGDGQAAVLHFASKDHDLFASVAGQLSLDDDRATIERFWNPFVAAWYEEGIKDPKLQLLRFEPAEAQIWLNEYSVFAGIKMLLGVDPKQDYEKKVAEVELR